MWNKESIEEFLEKDFISNAPLVIILQGDKDWTTFEEFTNEGISQKTMSNVHRITINELLGYHQCFIVPRERYLFVKEVQGNKHDDLKDIMTFAIPYSQIIRLEQDDEQEYFVDYWKELDDDVSL